MTERSPEMVEGRIEHEPYPAWKNYTRVGIDLDLNGRMSIRGSGKTIVELLSTLVGAITSSDEVITAARLQHNREFTVASPINGEILHEAATIFVTTQTLLDH